MTTTPSAASGSIRPRTPLGVQPAVDPLARAGRARVPLTMRKGLFGKFIGWYCRRSYGDVLEPAVAMSHNPRVLFADLMFEKRVGKFKSLDPTLTVLATMAVSVQIECSWCLDFGYYEAHHRGVDPAKISAIPNWQDSGVYSATERRVLEYAEAATATPPVVTDELAAALRTDLGDAAFVELTMMVAVENLRSRFNSSLGLASQGFSESCRVR